MSPPRQSLTLAVFTFLVLAGCASVGPATQIDSSQQQARVIKGPPGFVGEPFAGWVDANRLTVPDYDFSKVIVGDHGAPGGHAVQALHRHEFGMELVGYNPLVSARHPTAVDSGFGAMDVWDDGTNYYVCVTHFAGNGGADIVDITDPTDPVHLSSVNSGTLNSDCQFTDDGKYMFLGPFNGHPMADMVMEGRREQVGSLPVAGLYDPLGEGVSIWDVQDKANPTLLLYENNGIYHNLFTFTSKDANGNDTYWLLQNRGQYVHRFDPSVPSVTPVGNTDTMIHDMAVGQHPITGDWLLYTGQGFGMAIIDMNDPTNPVTIGHLPAEQGPDGVKGWHDQEFSPQLIDGRAILVVGSETIGATSEPYGIVDVTDPTDPVILSRWFLPGKPVSPEPNFYTMSPHEMGVWNGYVVSANYHAGVWLFDMGSPERLIEPVTIGHFYANKEPALEGAPQNPPFAFNPFHWGAYFDERGYIVTSDWATGLYVLKFEATNTWTAPPTRADE